MNKFLKEAAEIEQKSASHKSGDKGDFNEALLDGPKRKKVEPKQVVLAPVKEEEPLGMIKNINGVPKVVIDDPYLEPFKNDLLLRQDEFKK